MPDDTPPQSSIILYQTEDGRTRIQCRFENGTIWLTQIQMAELFQTTVPNINLHLKAIYAEGELEAEATIKSHLIVRTEGARQVARHRSPQLSGNSGWFAGQPTCKYGLQVQPLHPV